MEGKLKISQSSKLHSMLNLFNKLSFGKGKNIKSKTAPLKEKEKKLTKTDNWAIKTLDEHGTKKIHSNDNFNDSFTAQFSNLNINDASTNVKESTLQRCNNKLSFDNKDYDNSKNAFCFDKNIEVEESEDKSDIPPNNLRTTLCDTEIKIENNGKLVNINNKSPSNSDGTQNTPDQIIVERAPDKTTKHIGTQRINPLERKDYQEKKRFAEEDKIIDSLIENLRQQEHYLKVSEEIESFIVIEQSKSLSLNVKSNVLLNKNSQINLPSCSDREFIEADEMLEKRYASTPESECSSPDFLLNGNERVEDFFYGIQNCINDCFQGDKFLNYSKFNQAAQEKIWYSTKNGYLNTIASKNQQAFNYELVTKARHRLFNSGAFSKDKCIAEYYEMYCQIRTGEFGTKDKKVIHNLKPTGAKKYRRTNLHAAVMEENLEKTFCIVEMHKQYHDDIHSCINIRDNKGKAVLDRARENRSSIANDLLIEYLLENNAQHSIHKMIPINTPGA